MTHSMKLHELQASQFNTHCKKVTSFIDRPDLIESIIQVEINAA